jgi:hypothetical protein
MTTSNVIPGFKKLSKQRILNMAVAHIAVTRQLSIRDGGCVYGESGCNAAPLLTPDGRALADSIGSWDYLVETGVVPGNNAAFIKELQEAHDSVRIAQDFMPTWKDNMRKLAERWNLSTSTLDKVPA